MIAVEHKAEDVVKLLIEAKVDLEATALADVRPACRIARALHARANSPTSFACMCRARDIKAELRLT